MRVELHPEARAEVRAAALWYEERRSGWGDRFVERVNEVLQRLEDTPARYPIWPGTEVAPVPIQKQFWSSSRTSSRSNFMLRVCSFLPSHMRSGSRYTGSLERAKGPANTRMEPTSSARSRVPAGAGRSQR